jgi:hypothetical protein
LTPCYFPYKFSFFLFFLSLQMYPFQAALQTKVEVPFKIGSVEQIAIKSPAAVECKQGDKVKEERERERERYKGDYPLSKQQQQQQAWAPARARASPMNRFPTVAPAAASDQNRSPSISILLLLLLLLPNGSFLPRAEVIDARKQPNGPNLA